MTNNRLILVFLGGTIKKCVNEKGGVSFEIHSTSNRSS